MSLLFDNPLALVPVTVFGSSARNVTGIGGTKQNPGELNRDWFPGDYSFIMGTTNPANLKPHHANWDIMVDRRTFDAAEGGFLIIACDRPYGGLHTKDQKTNPDDPPDATIYLNEQVKDTFQIHAAPSG
ncbi:MAG: hypothetical protein ACREDR_40205, partial [Blastocatellia bacterium]